MNAKPMFVWFFPLGKAKHNMKKTFMKGSELEDINTILNVLATLFTNCKRQMTFYNQKVQDPLKTFVIPHHLKTNPFKGKSLKMDELEIFNFSLVHYFSKFFFSILEFISFQKILKSMNDLHQPVFFNNLFHLFYNKILNLSLIFY
jgi:hypothetical protein